MARPRRPGHPPVGGPQVLLGGRHGGEPRFGACELLAVGRDCDVFDARRRHGPAPHRATAARSRREAGGDGPRRRPRVPVPARCTAATGPTSSSTSSPGPTMLDDLHDRPVAGARRRRRRDARRAARPAAPRPRACEPTTLLHLDLHPANVHPRPRRPGRHRLDERPRTATARPRRRHDVAHPRAVRRRRRPTSITADDRRPCSPATGAPRPERYLADGRRSRRLADREHHRRRAGGDRRRCIRRQRLSTSSVVVTVASSDSVLSITASA